ARSSPVRINSEVKDSEIPVAAGVGLGVAAVAAGVGLADTLIQQETGETLAIPQNRLILEPRNSQNAYAYWEIDPEKHAELQQLGEKKLVLRLYDITGGIDLDKQQAHCVREYDCEEEKPELNIAIPQSDRDYVAELGYITEDDKWLKIARSSAVQIKEIKDNGIPAAATSILSGVTKAGAAVAGAVSLANKSTPTTTESQVFLVVRDLKNAEAYWEISEAQQAEWQKTGKQLLLRVYDITGIDLNKQPANSLQEYECNPKSENLKIVIPQSDRDYIAELGYITNDGKWLKIARSASLRIVNPSTEDCSAKFIGGTTAPAKPPSGFIGNTAPVFSDGVSNTAILTTNVIADTSKTTIHLTGDLAKTISAAVVGLGTAAPKVLQSPQNGSTKTGDQPQSKSSSRIILVPYNAQSAYAYWEVTEDHKIALQQQGGKKFMLRVHDATNLDIDYQQPHSTQEYQCEETQQDQHITVPVSNRDYIAEVGYYTNDGRWLRLIRSFHVRVPLSL
ncbi:MAG: DUF4912 domain-containing protein, partial [Phormidium sp.]